MGACFAPTTPGGNTALEIKPTFKQTEKEIDDALEKVSLALTAS